jgi:polyisoprenoid-binding protein YceI
MKKLILIFFCFSFALFTANAQRFITKTGHIKFHSDSPLEKIEANNRQVKAIIDITTGDFIFTVLMKSFEFEKALMQEHFNENYVESDKFPNATFLGKVTNIKDVDVTKDGTYDATVEGKLTIHGVTRFVKEQGTFEVKSNKINGKAKFNLLLGDYGIKVPGAVTNNISKTIEITVEVALDKFN